MSQTQALVGLFYRPPAKAIVEVLSAGSPLTLRPEPDNPTDPNAIQVWLRSTDIPEGVARDKLALTGPLFGYTLDEILAQPEWHLGYVPRIAAQDLAPRLHGNELPAKLTFAASGAPQVTFDLAHLTTA